MMIHSVGKEHKCHSTTISKVFNLSVNKCNGVITETAISKSTQWEILIAGKKANIHSYSKDKADRSRNRRQNAQIRRRTKNSPVPQGLPTWRVSATTKVNYQ